MAITGTTGIQMEVVTESQYCAKLGNTEDIDPEQPEAEHVPAPLSVVRTVWTPAAVFSYSMVLH